MREEGEGRGNLVKIDSLTNWGEFSVSFFTILPQIDNPL